jgi:hypothetical protein
MGSKWLTHWSEIAGPPQKWFLFGPFKRYFIISQEPQNKKM